jgi:hypothetical protein
MKYKILDKFLPPNSAVSMSQALTKIPYYLHGSRPGQHRFFNSDIRQGDIEEVDLLVERIVKLSCIKNIKILRVYTNLSSTGAEHSGELHTDDGSITAMFYPGNWHSTWGGGTRFQGTENTDFIVNYIENRLLLFSADTLHMAESHNNTEYKFRWTVAIKMEAEWNL